MRLKWNCLDDKIGIRSQSCCSDFMKGGQAPDSIKGSSAVISGYFLFLRFCVYMVGLFYWNSFYGFLIL